MIKHYLLLIALAISSIHHSSVYAVLVFDWSFDDSGSTGPITGTISFAINPGDGGTGLIPTSIVITSAPGHDFIGPYLIGNNLVGDTATWNTTHLPATPPWEITTSNVVTTGFARFGYTTLIPSDHFYLAALPSQESILTTGLNTSPTATTQGTATFTAQSVPEPSAFLCVGLVGLGLVGWRRRVLNRDPSQRFHPNHI